MRVPVWLTLGIAVLVTLFGLYRIRLGLRKTQPEDPSRARVFGGGMGQRAHLFIGVIYILLGVALSATSFGFNPLG